MTTKHYSLEELRKVAEEYLAPIIEEHGDDLAAHEKLIRALLTELTEAEDNLQCAIWRLEDMLEGDDGQAWKEAARFVAKLKEARE